MTKTDTPSSPATTAEKPSRCASASARPDTSYRSADLTSNLRPPPGKIVEWAAKPNGQYYDFELEVGIEVVKRRAGSGVTVKAQTAYYALREASRLLCLAPEHIDLEMKDE